MTAIATPKAKKDRPSRVNWMARLRFRNVDSSMSEEYARPDPVREEVDAMVNEDIPLNPVR